MLASAPVPSAAAPEPEFAYLRGYGVEQGLSQNSVNDILQDRDGFLWIATQDGLNRFDGYDFVVFRAEADNPDSLSNSDVSALLEDRAGRLWVGMENGGLNLLDRTTEQAQAVVLDGTVGRDDRIAAMASCDGEQVWVGKADGLVRLAGFAGGAPGIAAASGTVAPALDSSVADLACTDAGVLWVATPDRGLLRLGADDAEFRSVELPARAGVDSARLEVVVSGHDGSLWIGADGPALYRIDDQGRKAGWIVPGRSARVRDLLVDRDGGVWITGLGIGLLRFDPATGEFIDYGSPSSHESGLSDTDTYSLYLDRSGVLWIGTLSGGLNNLGIYSGGFERFRADPEQTGRLSHNMVTAFAAQGDDVWIGTDGGGLDLFDPDTGTFRAFRNDPERAASLPNDRVWALLVDSQDTLWLGTWGDGLLRKTGEDEFEAIRMHVESAAPTPRNVTALAEDASGDIWIGTEESGLYRWRRADGVMRQVDARLDDGATLGAMNIADLHVGGAGALWIATWGHGLVRLTAEGNVTNWRHDPGDSASLASDTVRSISEDQDGKFWLGTADGLTLFDPAAGRVVRNYGVNEGLPASMIYAALPDAMGRVWVSSNRGIVRFDPETETTRTYDPRDGLQGFEFNGAAALAARDGYLYFGGTNGFNRFRPSALRDNPFPPDVVLTDFSLFNEIQRPGTSNDALLERALFATDDIVLDHDQDVVAIQFAALHFVSPERNRYAYRLDGFDRDWNYTDADRRIATYTNLDPGSYRLRVKAANSDGVWSDDEATVRLDVLAPWWVTPPAMLAYALAAVLLITLFVRWRTLLLRHRAADLRREVRDRTRLISKQKDTIEEQAQKVEQVLRSKEQLFARVSHEFRTPLTLILGALEWLRNPGKEASTDKAVGTIDSSGRRLLHLVDQLLGLASLDEARPTDPQPQALHSITNLAVNSFESLAESKRIGMTIKQLDEAWVMAAPEALDQVVLNLLSNAIKFTPEGGRIVVDVERLEDQVLFRVADSGIGVDPELKERIFEPFERGSAAGSGSGIGLALVREVVTSLGGTIALESEVGNGATFEIRLPTCPAPARPETQSRASADRLAHAEVDALGRAIDRQASAPDADEGATDTDERPDILVVEDNAELRRFLVETLGEYFRVVSADDGTTALPRAREELPDLIVSDVMMPGMDGFDFCHAIKSDERTSHIPVILLTAREDRESQLKGLEEGADDYLTKPFDATALRLRVRNVLETRQMLRARLAAELDRSATTAGAAVDEAVTVVGRRDREFLNRLTALLQDHYGDADLTVADIADSLALSERQLQRKLKALVNRSPSEHLRIFRLRRAAELIRDGHPIGNVAADTGFSSASHFAACFKALFDKTPSEYRGQQQP